MYQATCADCCSECEVPFKPTAERPVYCKTCFAKRKAGGGHSQANVRPAQMPEQRAAHAKGAESAGAKSGISSPPVASAKPAPSKKKKSKPAKKAKR